MPAPAIPSPWVSVAKEIPALVARQLRDNDIPPPAHSPGNPWYRSWKFWIPAGIIIVVLVCVGGGLAAAGSGGPRLVVEPSEQEKEEFERMKREHEELARRTHTGGWPLYLALKKQKEAEERRRYMGYTLEELAKAREGTTQV